jgi:hypothetical protein
VTKSQRTKLIVLVVLTDLLVVGLLLYKYLIHKP